jgi:hypothetical protein
MNDIETIVHDYIMWSYKTQNSNVLEEETFHSWWMRNRDRYNRGIEKVLLTLVKETMFDMAFNDDDGDISKN